MAIVLVLGFLLVLMVLLTEFSLVFVQVEQLQSDVYQYEQNQMIARSALEMAIVLLDADSAKVDSFFDTWNQIQPIVAEDWTVKVSIEDLDRKFWINSVANNSKIDPLLAQRFLERFLTNSGHSGKSMVPLLVDWIDSDSSTLPGGAEQSRYRDSLVPNAPLSTLVSLSGIERWKESKLEPPRTERETNLALEYPGMTLWDYYFTCYSSGKVNLNTASFEVIEALDSDMNQGLVQEVIGLRKRGEITSFDELKALNAFDEDFIFRLERLAGFSSEFFQVQIQMSKGQNQPYLFQAVVHRKKPKSEVVSWTFFEESVQGKIQNF